MANAWFNKGAEKQIKGQIDWETDVIQAHLVKPAYTLDLVGELATEEGDYAHAPAYFQEALQIYRELFYNNVENLLGNNFPVIRALRGDAAWHALVRDFYREHRCHTPLFPELGREFLRYLEARQQQGRGDPDAHPGALRVTGADPGGPVDGDADPATADRDEAEDGDGDGRTFHEAPPEARTRSKAPPSAMIASSLRKRVSSHFLVLSGVMREMPLASVMLKRTIVRAIGVLPKVSSPSS